MRFSFTEDQQLFRDAVRTLLVKACPPDKVRAVWSGQRAEDLWAQVAEMGLTGMLVPESHGGLGMGAMDVVLVLEEFGRAAAPIGFVETAVVAPVLLCGTALAQTWLPQIGDGSAHVAVGIAAPDGVKPVWVRDAATADLVLLWDGQALTAHQPDQIQTTRLPSVDGARALYSVETSAGTPVDVSAQQVERAWYWGAFATAAQQLGLGRAMLDLAVDYAGVREQFKRPIGSFQAVKHHLADALVGLEMAGPVVYRAAHSLDADRADAHMHVSMAKAQAGGAAHQAGRKALQVHGAIGYSFEHNLHLWLKRGWALEGAWGTPRWHREHLAGLVLDGEGDPTQWEQI